MIRKLIIRVGACIVFILLTLCVLFYAASMPNRTKNGFTRHFSPNFLQKEVETELGEGITRISGSGKNTLYFSGQFPSWILVTDKQINVLDTMWFGVKRTEQFPVPNTLVDSPNVYMFAGNMSTLISGKLGLFEVDTLKINTPVFMRSLQISPNETIIRGFDETQMQQELRKIDNRNGAIVAKNKLFDIQNDLGVSTDGRLKYDKKNNKIVYIQLYENKFYYLDTNLNSLYKSHTIDTTSTIQAPLKTVNNGTTFKVMPSKGLNPINIESYCNDGLLYVISGLAADNEDNRDFGKNYPVDIYDLESNGKYLYSYYLPKKAGKKILNFIISDDSLIAVYEKGVVVKYKMQIPSR